MITGTMFVIIVTRRLTPEEFGLWTLIGSMVVYVSIVQPIITYWATRQMARGEEVGKTALATGGLFSIGGFAIYSIIAIFVSFQLGAELLILMLASALVPLTIVNNILNGICLSFKPQSISYGLLVFETTKVPFGFLLVVLMELGIVGAILTTIVASSIRLIILFILAKERIIGEIKTKVIKFWLRMSWLTVYVSMPGMLKSFDILIFSFMTNSLIGLAFWGIGQTISTKIAASESLSQGLYPKLLATRKQDIARLNLQRTMYFAIPLLGATVVFAKPILYVLNPIYIDITLVVILLSFRSIIGMLTSIFFTILQAFETVDLDKSANFKQYVKSKLFYLPTLHFIFSGSYLAILAIILMLRDSNMTDEVTVNIWASIYVAVSVPFMLYGLIAIKKFHNITFPYRAIGKYIGVTLVSSIIVFLILENYLTYEPSIWDFLPQLIPIIVVGGLFYFGITYVIDQSSRELFKSIIKELKK